MYSNFNPAPSQWAIFSSKSGAISTKIGYPVPSTTVKGDDTISAIEDASEGELVFIHFADNLPQGVYNGDEGF